MTTTTTRVGRGLAGLAALTLLAGCTTAVSGSGRPAGGGRASGSSSGSSGSSGSSSGSSGSGDFSASGDPHDTWDAVIAATTSSGGTVRVRGIISGAGVSNAKIAAAFSTGDDGKPDAVATVTVDAGNLRVTATGGSAWATATAAVYEAYGYAAAGSAQADGKQVVLTDDDNGLDVYAALDSFLSLCGPDSEDPASLDEGTYDGRDVLVVNDDKYGTETYVDPSDGHVLASTYDDETVTFEYSDDQSSVQAPAAADVVTVDGF